MYTYENKSKQIPGEMNGKRRNMNDHPQQQQQTQPIVHVGFGPFDTPASQHPPLPQYGMDMSGGPHERRSSGASDDLMTQRFVAGEQFYNYEMYGSLRKGTAVSFFSWYCFGLMAAVFTSVLSYQCLQSTIKPYLISQLDLKGRDAAIQRLVELPMTLSFFIGLLSDGYPIMGLRRKGYMVLGLVINAASVLALGGISMYFETQEKDEHEGWLVIISIVLISLASIGCIITYLCVHTRVIELSQREPLRRRGAIIAEYLIFRRVTSFLGAGYAFFVFGWEGQSNKDGEARIPFSTAMFVLALVSTLPLPIILRYWKEEHYNLSTTMSVRCRIFWKIMQQKAVWRVLMFIVVFQLFLSIKFTDSISIIRTWAHAGNDNVQVLRFIADAIGVATLIAWRMFFMNTLWARFYCWAPILQILPNLLVSVLVTQNLERDRYVYRSLVSVPYIADTLLTLNPVVPLIEIIQEGSEGATVGLTLSLYRIINIFVNTNAAGLFRGSYIYDANQAKLDTSEGRDGVMWSTVVVYCVNALALFGLLFLPSQKLDAQQLRMYGGFTKAASTAIVVFSVALFLYSMTINILTFIPSTKCYPLVGGTCTTSTKPKY